MLCQYARKKDTESLTFCIEEALIYTQQVQITILIIALTAFKWNNGKIDIQN